MMPQNACPSTWALERSLLGEAPADAQTHIDGCTRCQQELARRRAHGHAYMGSDAAKQLRERLNQAENSGSAGRTGRLSVRTSRLLLAALVLIPLAGVTMLVGGENSVLFRGAGEPMLTAKGEAQLSLWVGNGGESPRELGASDANVVDPGERVQPALVLPHAAHCALFVVSPAREVTPLLSENGSSAALEARPAGPVGPSFRLDDELGRYRVVLLTHQQPFRIAELAAALKNGQRLDFAGSVSEQTFQVIAE